MTVAARPANACSRKPKRRRGLRFGEVGAEVAVDVEERLLEDVRRVEPAPYPRVDPQLDHAPESVAILVELLRQGPRSPPRNRSIGSDKSPGLLSKWFPIAHIRAPTGNRECEMGNETVGLPLPTQARNRSDDNAHRAGFG